MPIRKEVKASPPSRRGVSSNYPPPHPDLLVPARPDLPVGGRLSLFASDWDFLCPNKWVRAILDQGYRLSFDGPPPQDTGIKETRFLSKKQEQCLTEEVASLLSKDAIEPVPVEDIHRGYYCNMFTVPKKDSDDLRPILNLKPLNRGLVVPTFRMETLQQVSSQVQPGDYLVSLDLKDAYLHVPIHPEDRRFLRFSIHGRQYQWKVLVFGLSTSPRVFTKVMAPIVSYLRSHQVYVYPYLDDWLVRAASIQEVIRSRDLVLQVIQRVGLILNAKKSHLTPSQDLVFIGGRFRTDLGQVMLPQDRAQVLKELTLQVVRSSAVSARTFLRLLGLMAASIAVVRFARLRMRPLQCHLMFHYTPQQDSLEKSIPVTQDLIRHLLVWTEDSFLFQGISLLPTVHSLILTSDSSATGWGAHFQDISLQGVWSLQEQAMHINVLELRAARLAVQQLVSHLSGHTVLLRLDNTAAVAYVNKQGGTKSFSLCWEAVQLWNFAIQNNIFLKAAHLPGLLNQWADSLSRRILPQLEWKLCPSVVRTLFSLWDTPHVDLFAADHNHQLPVFCSLLPSASAYHQDALSLDWRGLLGYAFPPAALLLQVLQKVFRTPNCHMILIAPVWPQRPWYPNLLSLLVDYPRILPCRVDLLMDPVTRAYHPQPQDWKLAAWRISTAPHLLMSFHQRLSRQCRPQLDVLPKALTSSNGMPLTAGVIKGNVIPLMHL